MKLNKTYEKLTKIKTPVLISLDAPTDDPMGGGHRVRILYPNGLSTWYGENHSQNCIGFTDSCFIDDSFKDGDHTYKSEFVGSLKDTVMKMVEHDKSYGLKIKGIYEL